MSDDLDFTGTTHTNVGTYTDTWVFNALSNPNYTPNYSTVTGTVTDVINRANATISVKPISGLVYNSQSQETASYSAIGVNGALSSSDFSDTTWHTNAAGYSDTWSFSDPSGNYAPANGTVAGNIDRAYLTIDANYSGKIYDSTATVTDGTTPSVIGLYGHDTVTGLTESFQSQNVMGTNGSTIVVNSGFTINDGNNGNNYYNPTVVSTDGTITPTALIISANYDSKTYDGTTTVLDGTTPTVSGLQGSDTVTGLSESYTSPNVSVNGDTSYLVVSGYTVNDGNNGNNYVVYPITAFGAITPADAAPVVTGYTVTYDGNAYTANGSAIVVPVDATNGISLSNDFDLSQTVYTNVGNNIDSWSFNQPTLLDGSNNPNYNPNYAPASGTVTDVINQANANPVVTPISGLTYDGGLQETANYSAVGVNGVAFPSSDFTDNTVHTNAGTYTDNWTFTDPSGNYASASGTVTDNIAQASAHPSVTAISGLVYTGVSQETAIYSPRTSMVSPSSSDLSDLTVHTNAGQNTDSWSFSDPTGNYAPETGTVTDNIAQATASIVVTPTPELVYNGGPQVTATGTATGVGGVNLSSDLTINSTHTNAEIYPDTWSFTDPTGNYASETGTMTDTIGQATATILVTPTPGLIYNGGPQVTATGTATGVGGVNLSSDLTINSTHTNAEIYPDTWSFTDPTGNYASETGTMTDTIGQATATILVTPTPGLIYNGGPQVTATGTATGVGGVNLSSDLTINSTHTNAEIYPDTWSFTDPTGNYASETGTMTDTIGQATATILVTPTPGLIYNGGPQVTATGTATGVGGVNLSSDLTINSTHTNAEIYPDTWSFTDPTGNYASETGTMTDTIGQATATILVTPTPGLIYNGGPQVTATGTATGVGGVNLSSDLTINSTHTNAEIYPDTWSFTDPTGNYASETGTMTDTIGQATATILVTPTPGLIYNGGPQVTATGTATGVGGVNLSSDLTINSTHTNAEIYPDTWSFTDPTGNYASETGTMTDTIGQATATILVTPTPGLIYNGGPQETADYSATGVNGALPSSDFTDTTVHTNAGTYPDAWTFTDPNYVSQSGSVTDNIGQASLTITATSESKTYGHTASLAYTENGLVNSDTITSVTETSAGAASTAPVGSDPIDISNAVGTGLSNYTVTYVNGTLTVTPATLTITSTSH